ncbi:MAG: hypothetical protein ACK5JB_01095 [Pseudanabaena sp.]
MFSEHGVFSSEHSEHNENVRSDPWFLPSAIATNLGKLTPWLWSDLTPWFKSSVRSRWVASRFLLVRWGS